MFAGIHNQFPLYTLEEPRFQNSGSFLELNLFFLQRLKWDWGDLRSKNNHAAIGNGESDWSSYRFLFTIVFAQAEVNICDQ